jgi:transposase, IS30 family
MRSYSQFTPEDRIMLSALKRKGFTQKDIARELKKNQSSISREFSRNKKPDNKYHADKAQRKTIQRRKEANRQLKRIENDSWLKRYIVRKLKKYWSPEQIAGRVREKHGVIICHETIYRFIYNQRPDLKKYLRCKKGKYRRRYGTKKREKQREEAKKIRIDKRPGIIEKRGRVGDFEGDTVMGKRGTGALVTHVDRKSGYALIDRVAQATAKAISAKTIKRFKKIPKQKKHTITYDNGTEFSGHEMIGRVTKTEIYFAYPYHSWERGTNENTNGLIRQFFPKRSSFKEINQRDTKRVEHLLNTRPRKRLSYLTPAEVFVKNMHLT